MIVSSKAFQSAREQNWQTASKQAQTSLSLIKPLTFVSQKKSAAINSWQAGLELILITAEGQPQLKQLQQGLASSDEPVFDDHFFTWWDKFSRTFKNFSQSSQKSRLLHRLVSDENLEKIKAASGLLAKLDPLIKTAENQDLNFTILLQNNDEIRAAGGFMGSVSLLQLQQGHLSQPAFYDIYDLAGQTDQTLPAAPGFKQFLSEGKKMSLLDTNWKADFSQAGQDILTLLNSTGIPQTDILIASNLDLIRSLLTITGPIYLTDLDQTVTAENIGSLARANRLEFFAGDHQKKNFLGELYTQLKLHFEEAELEDVTALAAVLNSAFEQKQLLFYSPKPGLQQEFIELDIAGVIAPQTDHWLYLVESNVGINKANQAVERQIDIEIQDQKIVLKLEFYNRNQPPTQQQIQAIKNNPDLLQAPHLGYVNYQRLVTDLKPKEINIECEGQETKLIEERQILVNSGQVSEVEPAFQIGFLITVPEQNQQTCFIELTPAGRIEPTDSWKIYKQPGLPLTPYNITLGEQTYNFSLSTDKILNPDNTK